MNFIILEKLAHILYHMWSLYLSYSFE